MLDVFCLKTGCDQEAFECRWQQCQERIIKYAPFEQKKTVNSIVKNYHTVQKASEGMYRTLALLRPLRCYAPPPLQREVLLRVTFCSLIAPPHLHIHTCVWLALTSMFTLVLRCYYVIFAKCVRLFPCGRLRTCGTGL